MGVYNIRVIEQSDSVTVINLDHKNDTNCTYENLENYTGKFKAVTFAKSAGMNAEQLVAEAMKILF